MSFLGSLLNLFRKKQEDDGAPYSIVLLLRSSLALSAEVLSAAASRAFKTPYDGSHEMYFVVQDSPVTMIKAGSALINVLSASEAYLGDPTEVAQGFRDERLKSAWMEHCAWTAFDLMNSDMPKKQAYRVLAPLVSELLDARCVGIYFPKENQFTLQSDGSAVEHLRSLGR